MALISADECNAIAKRWTGEEASADKALITAEREKYWTYAASYFETSYVILTRRDTSGVNVIKDLHGKTVAVERGYNLQGRLSEDHPDIELKVVDSTLDALQAVSREQADAYVGNQVVSLWLSDQHHLLNLKIAADSGYGLNRPCRR